MQGLILQLTRAGFLILLWLFVWAVLRTLRTDIYAASGVRVTSRASRKSSVLPSFNRQKGARYLVVTQGSLAGTRISLSTQPVLIGRADDSTLVLTDDYASTRHARLSPARQRLVRRGSRLHQRHLSRPREGDHRGPGATRNAGAGGQDRDRVALVRGARVTGTEAEDTAS